MASLASYSLAIRQISGCVLSENYSGGGGKQTNYIFHMDYNESNVYKKVVPKFPMKINRCPG